jgi:hypothetical protein
MSAIIPARLRCKRPVVAKQSRPRRIEQGIFRTIVQMAYEMDKAERDYYYPVTHVKEIMEKVFNEHYPQGRGLLIPKFVKDKQPKTPYSYRHIVYEGGYREYMDYQETDTPTKWSKRFYLPSITLARRVEQVEDNLWKITPYISFTGKVIFTNNHRQRCGKQPRLRNDVVVWESQWSPTDTFQQHARMYTVGIAYSDKSQGMEAFTRALTAYTSWLRDARDVNSLEQFNRLVERYEAGIGYENGNESSYACFAD